MTPTLHFIPLMPASMPAELESRIQFAYASSDLRPCERQVLHTLLYAESTPRVGRKNALRRTHMQAWWQRQGMLPYGEREIKAAVKGLVEMHGAPIGSSRSTTPGYYLIASEEDLAAARGPILGEITSLRHRAEALDWRTPFARRMQGQQVIQ